MSILKEMKMSNLLEQYQGHPLFQTLTNKLDEIQNGLQSEAYNDVQKDSLLAYQQILTMIQTNLNTRTLPIVPNRILNDLNAAIQNLHISYMLDMNNNYSYYQQLMNSYRMLFTIEKKSEVKESFNSLIDGFLVKQDKIKESISKEIDDFRKRQDTEIDDWQTEKEQLMEEIKALKVENTQLQEKINGFNQTLTKQEEKINKLISDFQTEYKENTEDFETRFTSQEDEFNEKIKALLDEQKSNANDTLKHLEKRKDEVEKLWGIIGQSAISGNSQNYANNAKLIADIMMYITLGIMLIVVSVLAITTYLDLKHGTFNYIHFMYKIIGSTIFLVPAFYCSNISKRHRDREFQLRDFEVKTAALEPFMENMILETQAGDDINKDKVKLELTKTFFDKQFSGSNNSNDCIIIPKEIAKIINTFAKKCNINLNLGDKNE